MPPVANNFALGYSYYDVLDADQDGLSTPVNGIVLFTDIIRYSCPSFALSRLTTLPRVRFPSRSSSYPRSDPEYCFGGSPRLVTTSSLATTNMDMDSGIPEGGGATECGKS